MLHAEPDDDLQSYYTHEVPEGYRLMVLPFVDSSEAICTVHPTPCPHAWCTSYWMNYAITKVTGSKYTHCELYWPHTTASISVDSELNVHQKRGRTYMAQIGRWEFLSLLITEDQEWHMMQYIQAQDGKRYDTTSFYLFWLLSSTSCIQPHVRPLQHKSCPGATEQQLREHLPPTETCARLLMGALVYAGVVTPRDVRLATPHSVYRALVRLGAQSSYTLPTTPPAEHSIYIPSACEMAMHHHYANAAQQPSRSKQLGYVISGGITYEQPHGGVHGGAVAGGGEAYHHYTPHGTQYWQDCGVEVPASRFVPPPLYEQ